MKMDAPRECDNFTQDCKCDFCGSSLNSRKTIWVLHEFLGCCKAHIIASKNEVFKQSGLSALNYGVSAERLQAAVEESDDDLL